MEILQAKALKKVYGSGNNAVHALDGGKRQILRLPLNLTPLL